MTEEALNVLLKLWQRRLGLMDWTIKLELTSLLDFPESYQNCFGLCDFCEYDLRAHIQLLDPKDYPHLVKSELAPELEEVLIHELLHLVFPHISRDLTSHEDSLRYYDFERGLNALARSFKRYL